MAALPDRRRSRQPVPSKKSARPRARRFLLGEELEARRVLDSTVVISELMYHPAGDNSGLEWVELHNELSINMDLSGWSLADGIDYTFPPTTIIPGGGYLVVAANPALLAQLAGFSGALGPFAGQLSNGGETIELRDNNARVMDSLSYGDDGEWTPGADGSGASLAKLAIGTATADPQRWSFSAIVGGTPGAENFPGAESQPPISETLLTGGAPARVLVPTQAAALPADWYTTAFNDQAAGWFDRTLGVGYGAGAVAPLIDANGGIGPQMLGVNESAFVRTSFQVEDPNDLASLKFSLDYDDGFVAYLNGVEIARRNAPDGTPAFNATASQPVGSTVYNAGQDMATMELASPFGVNPNGAWSYGASLSLGGAFISYPAAGGTHTNDYMQTGSPLQGYSGPPLQLPILVVNTSNNSYSPCCGFSIAPKTIFMHPGVTNVSNYDVVRWTAPAAGEAALSNVSFLKKGSKRAPEYILHNGEIVVSGYGNFTPGATSIQVSAGDTIDFVVGPDLSGPDNQGAGDDPNGSRSVQFDARITLSSGRLELDISDHIDLLNAGANVLAIQGLNASVGDVDFLLRPELIAELQPIEVVPAGSLVINEVAAAASGAFFVELANGGDTPLDLAGYTLSTLGTTSSGSHVFNSQMLAPGALVTVTSAQLAGYSPVVGDRVFVTAPGDLQLLDAVTVRDVGRGRAVEQDNELAYVSTPTPGAANSFVFHDEIVINEIMYHHQPQWTSGPVSAIDSAEEWVELYNRGAQSVNLGGWRLDENIDYVFPADTILGAGQYLVVARNAVTLSALYPGITVLGNYSGSLPNSGGTVVLKDALGNVADQVDYLDAGRWPAAADGGGSSLELRDPDADNALGEAWAASDEGGKSTWQTYTYSGIATVNAGPVKWNEFVLTLLDSGEVLLDDIHVIESPSGAHIELIQNSTFETTLNKWRVLGNHQGTVIVDPTNPANHVLRMVADGPGEAMFNHAETTLAGNVAIVAGREYEISFRAKWVSGSPQLNSKLYFNWLPKTTIIDTPQLNGTPGAVNSRFQANIGPQFDQLVQDPVVPVANQAVQVAVDIADSDGVTSALLFWKLDGGSFASVNMTAGADGRYEGPIPGQLVGKIVQFYVQATDALGAVATFPAAGANSRALYKVGDGQALSPTLHTVQIITTAADASLLHQNTNAMSNDLIGATVIYDGTDIYHDVGVRLKGSVYGRTLQERIGYIVEFPPDHLFRGVQSQIALDRSGIGQVGVGGHEEIVAQHFLHHAGDVPAEYSDLVQMIAPLSQYNHTAILGMSRLGNDYLDTQYEDGSDGTQFDLELFYYTTTSSVAGNPESLKSWSAGPYIQNEIQNYGNDKEQYRNQFLIKNNRQHDDYQKLMEVAKAFSLTGAALKTATDALLDIDQWMRVFASQSLLGNLDIYSIGLPHNLFLYVRPEDGKVLAMPHDLDQAFVVAYNASLFGTGNLAKITSIPANRRLFLGHLQDMIATTYNTTYMSPWTTHYGNLVGQNYGGVLGYIGQRAGYVTSQLPASVPFQITTNGGTGFTTDQSTYTFGGEAWINVKQIFIEGRSEPLALTWTDLDSWQATVSLVSGEQALKFQAYNFQGQPLGFDTITVNSTAVAYTQFDNLRITELMYNPAVTAADAPYASTDFEYIELQNIGAQPLDLAGAQLGGGVTFTFTTLVLAPGARALVVNNLAAMTQRYGDGLTIAGEFAGNLNNSGEPLVLTDSLSQTILSFSYSPDWIPSTDGTGPSLVIKDAGGPAVAWTSAAGWRASSGNSGSPGLAEPATSVVARHVFYNNSKFDGNNGAAGAADDAAIAADKVALLPGGTATAANYTNYSRGINGIMLDVAGLVLPLSVADFAFRTGNDDTPADWLVAATPTVSVRPGAGVGGTDRVTLVWADGAIQKTWLQVTVLGGGLSTPDVFYFGNAVGDSGNSAGDVIVNATDEVAARTNSRSFLNPAGITFAYDYNRDGMVNATDQILSRSNTTTLATSLKLITAPAAALAADAIALSSESAADVNDGLASRANSIAVADGASQVAQSLPAVAATSAPAHPAPRLLAAASNDQASHADEVTDASDEELFELLALGQLRARF